MTIYAIAIASNSNKTHNTEFALKQLMLLGQCRFSAIYEIPCRDAVGADYWNCACLLDTDLAVDEVFIYLKEMELLSGRIRPSHSITLDMDLIAWGEQLSDMQFNAKKLPLAQDVIIPLSDLWQTEKIYLIAHDYRKIPELLPVLPVVMNG